MYLTYVFRIPVRPLLRTISDFGFTSDRRLTSTISYSIFQNIFYLISFVRQQENPQTEQTLESVSIVLRQTDDVRTAN